MSQGRKERDTRKEKYRPVHLLAARELVPSPVHCDEGFLAVVYMIVSSIISHNKHYRS